MAEHAFDPSTYESRWQAWWEEHKTFEVAADPSKPKFYALGMFPYPSGNGLHVGHPESYTALDIVARYKRMNGYCVLHPMGWDAFGLPAERAAVRSGEHPRDITRRNIAHFKHQLKRLGFSYDWSREISTCEVDYYRWTQWIFLKLHERGLAYLADVAVNWCPAQGTVLANEEVVDGRYVETGDPVERRTMKQWMLQITAYAQRLLDDLDDLDWPEHVKEMQRQWIGRSEGAELTFAVQGHDDAAFVVFTTRPDTVFGATYCVLAPEHPLVERITTTRRREAVQAYVADARNRSDLDRQKGAEKEKTGVFTGAFAVNPATGAPVPVYVADYVLMSYGTGAIMAVPAHDERDHAFARAHDLPIVEVVTAPEGHDVQAQAWSGGGVLCNSGDYDGLDAATAKARITDDLAARDLAVKRVNYKLRDWLFSRQRYWGEPFPVVHLDDGTVRTLTPADLPVELPHVEAYKPTADGRPPLARAEDWLHTTLDGQPALRETNTMPQWAGSCWYYLRYMDPHNTERPFDPALERYWGPVDLYIGGVEHAVLHLLYARFWHKVLFDCGLVHTKEPFQKLFNQGMILAYGYRDANGQWRSPDDCAQRQGDSTTFTAPWDGSEVTTDWYASDGTPVEVKVTKMSKSRLNVVDPLDVVDRYGADALRLYEMFMGPLEQVKPWQTSGVEGVHRFLGKVWRLFVDADTGAIRPFGETSKAARKALHVAIKETTEGIEQLKFNTPISKMMELVKALEGQLPSREDAEAFLVILSPYAPHLAEELWYRLGHTDTLADEPWPKHDPAALVDDELTIAVQVMGKTRGTIQVPRSASKDEILAAARADEKIARHLEGKTVRKEIVVPGRLVNFVAN